MIPVECDDIDVAILGGRKITLGKGQKEFIPLPAIIGPKPLVKITSRWQLTDDERQRLAAGQDLYITSTTFGTDFQAIQPAVGLPVPGTLV